MEISKHGKLTNEEVLWIKHRLEKERKSTGTTNYNWDINLAEGLCREEIGKRLLEGAITCEVKTDFLVCQNGNVAIEYSCNGHPSGIAKTKAKYYWVFFGGKYYFDEVSVIISTERLRNICRHFYKIHQRGGVNPDTKKEYVIEHGGEGKRATFILLPKNELLGLMY